VRLDAERAPLAAVDADPLCALLASLAPRELGCVVAVAQSEQDAGRIRAFYIAQHEAAEALVRRHRAARAEREREREREREGAAEAGGRAPAGAGAATGGRGTARRRPRPQEGGADGAGAAAVAPGRAAGGVIVVVDRAGRTVATDHVLPPLHLRLSLGLGCCVDMERTPALQLAFARQAFPARRLLLAWTLSRLSRVLGMVLLVTDLDRLPRLLRESLRDASRLLRDAGAARAAARAAAAAGVPPSVANGGGALHTLSAAWLVR